MDIETEGLNPLRDKIITVQHYKLELRTGKPVEELKILIEWKFTENRLLRLIIPRIFSYMLSDTASPWGFIPVGKNIVGFNLIWLVTRAYRYKTIPEGRSFNWRELELNHPTG